MDVGPEIESRAPCNALSSTFETFGVDDQNYNTGFNSKAHVSRQVKRKQSI